ncbi:variable surface protein [Plasmodium gonderi]|uniref:Variable surface protein n=1 Tax=Plasmodium gonderi TaxID=77519 RepID=A0A1Y1JT71_PLAGO|nr:variable surface protein [Plasmodium gonderi]GAW84337.1 variable surface protein [Plasmodium gonderi]
MGKTIVCSNYCNVNYNIIIYEFVNSFSECELLFNSSITHSNGEFTSQCSNINNVFSDVLGTINNTICSTVMAYLKKIHDTSYDRIKEASCKYMYFWMYNKLKGENKAIYTKTLYDIILFVYKRNSDTPICNDFIKTNITDNHMQKVNDMYDLYTKLNNINDTKICPEDKKCYCANKCSNIYMNYKDACNSNNNKDFCSSLDEFRVQYNAIMKNKICKNLDYQILPSFRTSNSIVPISITIVLILILLLFLCILYKCTSCGSHVHHILKRKRNKWNKTDEKWNVLQQSENSKSISDDIRYNLLYSCD